MKKYNEYRVCEALKLALAVRQTHNRYTFLSENDNTEESDNIEFRRQVEVILKMQEEFIEDEDLISNFNALNVRSD